MKTIQQSSRFKKMFKQCKKRKVDFSEFKNVVKLLESGEPLPKKYRDHSLSGKDKDNRECHLEGDLLLVYKPKEDTVILKAIGTHSDLKFGEK